MHIQSYRDLRVYQAAIEAAMRVFNLQRGSHSKKSSQWLSDAAVVAISLCQHRRSMAQAAVRRPFPKQVK